MGETLEAQPVKLSDNDQDQQARELVWCELSLKNNDSIVVGTVYRSSNRPLENNTAVNKLLTNMSVDRSHVMILGDFNHPEINWTDDTKPRDLHYPAFLFMEAETRSSFNMSKNPHYRGEQTPNVLDLIFTN